MKEEKATSYKQPKQTNKQTNDHCRFKRKTKLSSREVVLNIRRKTTTKK